MHQHPTCWTYPPFWVIVHVTGRAISLHHTHISNPCEDCNPRKIKEGSMSKKAIESSKVLGERLFFNIRMPLSPTLGGKKHWLHFIEEGTNHAWRAIFEKRRPNWKHIMTGLIKNLKINMVFRSSMHSVVVLEKIMILKGLAHGKGWGWLCWAEIQILF